MSAPEVVATASADEDEPSEMAEEVVVEEVVEDPETGKEVGEVVLEAGVVVVAGSSSTSYGPEMSEAETKRLCGNRQVRKGTKGRKSG